MLEWIEAWLQHSSDLEELILGRNSLLTERPGVEPSTEATRPAAKRLGGLNVLGKKETSGGNGLGQNDSDFRRQNSNMFYPL